MTAPASRPRNATDGDQLQLPLSKPRASQPAAAVESADSDTTLLDIPQVAATLGCGRTYVFELLATGQLPMVKLGRLTRIPRSALREFVEQRTIRAVMAPGVDG